MMKRLMATAAAAFLVGVTGASAEMILQETANDEWVWVDTETQTEHRVIQTADGLRPADCPAGAFFIGKDPVSGTKKVVQSCDTDEFYGLSAPASGSTMASGDPYPAGTYLLTERDDEWNVLTDQDL
ncbi:MAG TPA: hypothetical protein VGA77_08615 [Propylenella sp.]